MDFYKNSEFANSLKISQELDLDLKFQHNWSNFIASKKSTVIISRIYLDYPFFVSKAEYWINILNVKVFLWLEKWEGINLQAPTQPSCTRRPSQSVRSVLLFLIVLLFLGFFLLNFFTQKKCFAFFTQFSLCVKKNDFSIITVALSPFSSLCHF